MTNDEMRKRKGEILAGVLGKYDVPVVFTTDGGVHVLLPDAPEVDSEEDNEENTLGVFRALIVAELFDPKNAEATTEARALLMSLVQQKAEKALETGEIAELYGGTVRPENARDLGSELTAMNKLLNSDPDKLPN